MEQAEMIQSFARRHGVTLKRYGRSFTLSSIDMDGTSEKMHVVIHGRGDYTMVYHHEDFLNADHIERTWDSMDTSFKNDISLTFGEVDGLWHNNNQRMRLCKDFNVGVHDEDAFDERLFGACRALINLRETLFLFQDLDVSEDKEPELFDEAMYSSGQSPKKRRGGFADVAGLDSLKEKLSDEVIWPLTHKAKAARYRISPPNGMILFGPPGCGKTFFARKLAEETGFTFKMVFPSDIGGMIIHETQVKVARLFEEARSQAPCIICFDEIDAMIPRRTTTPGMEYQNTEVNEFLVQMSNCGERGVFVIGTTNNIDLIDPAALRSGRLDYHVEIPKPGLEQRKSLLKISLSDRPCGSIDLDLISDMTTGMTAADICLIVNKSAIHAAKADAEITTDFLHAAIKEYKKERCLKQGQMTRMETEETEYQTVIPQISRKKILS